MKQQTILILIMLFIFIGCGRPVPDMHTSRIALDWAGTYAGVLPCADCEGIKTEITLFEDHSYEMSTVYIGKDEQIFRRSGTFTWDEDGGTIFLDNVDPMHETNHYRVGENRLFKLDRHGNRINGLLERLPQETERQ